MTTTTKLRKMKMVTTTMTVKKRMMLTMTTSETAPRKCKSAAFDQAGNVERY